MTLAIAFPAIDPVIVEVGPFALRWYALSYVAGLVLGWQYMKVLARRTGGAVSDQAIDDFLLWATLAVVLGGRLGYVLFYNFEFYLANPGAILQVWRGGMAFHGGFLGIVVATLWFTRKRDIPLLTMGDMIASVAPIGLFFGRLANFINGELYGRTTDVAWGMVFPRGGPDPRHPSQLYQAALEGLVLFLVLLVLGRRETVRGKPGTLIGIFITGYGIARFIVEYFREPDAHIGYLAGGITMGQILSVPMILIGVGIIVWAQKRVPAK